MPSSDPSPELSARLARVAERYLQRQTTLPAEFAERYRRLLADCVDTGRAPVLRVQGDVHTPIAHLLSGLWAQTVPEPTLDPLPAHCGCVLSWRASACGGERAVLTLLDDTELLESFCGYGLDRHPNLKPAVENVILALAHLAPVPDPQAPSCLIDWARLHQHLQQRYAQHAAWPHWQEYFWQRCRELPERVSIPALVQACSTFWATDTEVSQYLYEALHWRWQQQQPTQLQVDLSPLAEDGSGHKAAFLALLGPRDECIELSREQLALMGAVLERPVQIADSDTHPTTWPHLHWVLESQEAPFGDSFLSHYLNSKADTLWQCAIDQNRYQGLLFCHPSPKPHWPRPSPNDLRLGAEPASTERLWHMQSDADDAGALSAPARAQLAHRLSAHPGLDLAAIRRLPLAPSSESDDLWAELRQSLSSAGQGQLALLAQRAQRHLDGQRPEHSALRRALAKLSQQGTLVLLWRRFQWSEADLLAWLNARQQLDPNALRAGLGLEDTWQALAQAWREALYATARSLAREPAWGLPPLADIDLAWALQHRLAPLPARLSALLSPRLAASAEHQWRPLLVQGGLTLINQVLPTQALEESQAKVHNIDLLQIMYRWLDNSPVIPLAHCPPPLRAVIRDLARLNDVDD